MRKSSVCFRAYMCTYERNSIRFQQLDEIVDGQLRARAYLDNFNKVVVHVTACETVSRYS